MRVKVSIDIEVLSINSVPGLLQELVNSYGNENITGLLVKEDDDTIKWETKINN
jgi:hypothetical protein